MRISGEEKDELFVLIFICNVDGSKETAEITTKNNCGELLSVH